MPTYQRKQIPYNPVAVLPFSNRYALVANQNQPINSDQLDGDFNYVIDSLNDLWAIAQGIGRGILPGSDNPLNVNKFPITDGLIAPTISWTQITSGYFSAQCIPTAALQNGCVTNPILGNGSVGNANIVAGAVQNNNITDNTIAFDKIQAVNSVHFQLFFNTQTGATLSGAKIQAGSLPGASIAPGALPGTAITAGTLPAAALVANSLTNDQLSPIIKIPIGIMMDWTVPGNIVPPPGWVKAIGGTLLIANYAALYAAYGTYYGGDGVTTFGIPDTRGRTIHGVDNGAAQPTGGRIVGNAPLQSGSAGGEETHVLTIPETPAHTHPFSSWSAGITGVAGDAPSGNVVTNTTSPTGGGLAHNNMSPYLLMPKIIYAGV